MESRSPWYLESNKEPYSDDRYVSHTKLVYIRENYINISMVAIEIDYIFDLSHPQRKCRSKVLCQRSIEPTVSLLQSKVCF